MIRLEEEKEEALARVKAQQQLTQTEKFLEKKQSGIRDKSPKPQEVEFEDSLNPGKAQEIQMATFKTQKTLVVDEEEAD